jgi:(6-4)DNA photolyase
VLKPEKLVVVKPGDHWVERTIRAVALELDLPLEIREDRHFLSTPEEFADFAAGRRGLLL